VRVRIVREPSGSVDGVTLRNYRVGATYDIPAMLAQYFVAEGFAVVEMRRRDRRARPLRMLPEK
jgi:hypothetical protein